MPLVAIRPSRKAGLPVRYRVCPGCDNQTTKPGNKDLKITAMDRDINGDEKKAKIDGETVWKEIDLTNLEKLNQIIDNSEEWMQGKLVLRAGKVSGVNKHYWNIQEQTGHVKCIDPKTNANKEPESIEETYLVSIPRW